MQTLSDLGDRLEWCKNHRPKMCGNRRRRAGACRTGRSGSRGRSLECGGALRAGMDVSSSWTSREWMNRGSELLDPDPCLAKRLLARGLQIEPNEAIAWFNLGIGLHQQCRIAAAVRAYRHCLALPHNKETDQAARNNLGSGFASARPMAGGMGYVCPTF